MILQADARHIPLADESVQCVVTSPPYWGLRDYGINGQIGLEPTPELYVQHIVEVFREVRRVLRDDGTVWINLGDSYARQAGDDSTKIADNGALRTGRSRWETSQFKQGNNKPPAGLKPKDLVGIPWRVAFALQADGWYLRSDIIWAKPNTMPESVTDRPTKSHEYIFLLAKSGETLLWYHSRKKIWANSKPKPHWARVKPRTDYGEGQNSRLHQDRDPNHPSARKQRKIHWVNLWRGRDYYFDQGAVKERSVADHLAGNKTHKGLIAYENGATEHRTKAGLVAYARKTAALAKQNGQRRMVDHVQAARVNGMPHDTPFGITRNIRSVWTIATQPFPEAHFATFPEDLIKPCILAGCPVGGIVLDPFGGSCTTVKVAQDLGRRGIALDLKPEYLEMGKRRSAQIGLNL